MFCQTCIQIVQGLKGLLLKRDTSLILLHHASAARLKAAGQSGCRFCYTFWDQYTEPERAFLLESDSTFPEPQAITELPDSSVDNEEAWTIRAEAVRRHVTECLLQPAHFLGGERFVGCYLFVVQLNAERELPVTGLRNDMVTFVLQPLPDISTGRCVLSE